MAYIGKGLDNGVRNQFVFAATQGQTSFSGSDSDGKTLAMTDILYTDCYQNGVKLKPTTDYTVTSTTLTLVSAASVNDVINIVSFYTFAVPDTVSASTGGTFAGGITATTGTFSGAISTPAATITTASNEEDALLIEQADGTDVGALRINNGSFILKGKNASSPVQIQTHDGNEDIEVDPDGFIKMETAGAERMRIDASGNALFSAATLYLTRAGNTELMTTNTTGTVTGGIQALSNQSVRVGSITNYPTELVVNNAVHVTVGTNGYAGFGVSPTVRIHLPGGTADSSNSGIAAAWTVHSDYRLKENIVPLTNSITRLKLLKPCNFNWREETGTPSVDGFIAHEAQEVVPEAVLGAKDAMRDEEYVITPAVEEVVDDDGNVTTEAVPIVKGTRSVPVMQGLDQSKIVPLLTSALQEAIAKIEALETRLTALEAE